MFLDLTLVLVPIKSSTDLPFCNFESNFGWDVHVLNLTCFNFCYNLLVVVVVVIVMAIPGKFGISFDVFVPCCSAVKFDVSHKL